jgi:hypothetical protein
MSIKGNTLLRSRSLEILTQSVAPHSTTPPQLLQQRPSIHSSRYSLSCTSCINLGLALICKDPSICCFFLGYLWSRLGFSFIFQSSYNRLMPARSKRDEDLVQKQSYISDAIYSPSASPTSFAVGLDEPPALSAFNSPALVTQNLSDTESEDGKETRGKVQDDLEFTAHPPPQPLSAQTSTPLHHEPEPAVPATMTGHTRAPVLAR